MNSITRVLRISDKTGFSLFEVTLVLGLSALLVGSLGLMCGSFLKETAPQAIEYNGDTYQVAPSLKATISAFDFQQTFLRFLEKSELCLSFGGIQESDYQKHRFLPISNDFNFAKLLTLDSLVQGKCSSTRDLIMVTDGNIEGFFEKMATYSDLESFWK